MNEIKLDPQSIIIRLYHEKRILRSSIDFDHHNDILYYDPTGSGKTNLAVAICGSQFKNRFSHIIITAPQQQIEEGYLSNLDRIFKFNNPNTVPISISKKLIFPARNSRDKITDEIKKYLSNLANNILVCTHAAFTKINFDNLPASLENRLLIVDEAHHIPKIADIWEERGGKLLRLTATPFRTDGSPVIKDGTKVYHRLLAEHMDEGYAPKYFENEIIGIDVEGDVSAEEIMGEKILNTDREELIINNIYEAWVRDGKPKAIIHVPSGSSERFANKLMQIFAIKDPTIRILNGVGSDNKRKKEFLKNLEEERKLIKEDYNKSKYDLILGVERVKEGTDWAICSNSYVVGISSSLQRIIQIIGRNNRNKFEIKNYPATKWKDTAKITFFVLGANQKALEKLEMKHSRHALLLCAIMTDYSVGQEWLALNPIIKGIKTAREKGLISEEDAEKLENEARNSNLSDKGYSEEKAKVSLELAEKISEENPQIKDIISEDISDKEIEIIVENLTSCKGGLGAKVQNLIEKETENYIKKNINILPSIDKMRRDIFDKVVNQLREETLKESEVNELFVRQVHNLTGGSIKDFCNRLINEPLSKTHPELLEEWDYEKNRELGLDPRELTAGSDKKAWWFCKKCSKKWYAVIGSRTRGIGCRYCAGLGNIPFTKEYIIEKVNEFYLKYKRFPVYREKIKIENDGRAWDACFSWIRRNLNMSHQDFFRNYCGKKEKFLSYKEAHPIVICHEFKNEKEYRNAIKNEILLNSPLNPQRTYKNKGWKGWSVYLGHKKETQYLLQKSIKDNKNIFIEELSKHKNIKEMSEKLDIPLKILYRYKKDHNV